MPRNRQESPYNEFLLRHRSLGQAADLILAGVSDFAGISTAEEFRAKAEEVKPKVTEVVSPTIRSLIEERFLSKRIDRGTLRRFSLAARAAEVALGHSPWHHQIVCALLLSRGKIVQMPNGAGKTLSVALAACEARLAGKQVHIATSNDYLAERDCRWMGSLYDLLGLRAGILYTVQTLQFQFAILEPGTTNLRASPKSWRLQRLRPKELEQVGEPAKNQPDGKHQDGAETQETPATEKGPLDESSAHPGVSAGETPDPGEAGAQEQLSNDTGAELMHSADADFIVDAALTKKEVVASGIVYGKIESFGFAYLEDSTISEAENEVLAAMDVLIVDECDAVMLDDLGTPLELTRTVDSFSNKAVLQNLSTLREVALALRRDVDFSVENRSVSLQYEIVRDLVNLTGADQFTRDRGHFAIGIKKALEAEYAYRRDEQYIVENGAIVIIDEKSGRPLFGRRYNGGLQEAIECKEGIAVSEAGQRERVATITINNFTRSYDIVSGTSGSVGSEKEYERFYGLEVIKIEPYERTRIDLPDLVFRTETEAIRYGVIEKAVEASREGRPVLVNVPSQRYVPLVAELLKSERVPVQALDATTTKSLGEEAEKVKMAGAEALITVCSKLSARGTDIVLTEEAKSKGGLRVIGFQRATDRRFDDQLLGRAARHGDRGDSVFVISLDSDLMKVFARPWLTKLLESLGMEEGVPIESNMITQRIQGAQRALLRGEQRRRLQVVEWDDVMDRHRSLFSRVRKRILDKENVTEEIETILDNWIFLWELNDSERSRAGGADDAHYSPIKEYLQAAEFERIKNVHSTKTRVKVLSDAAERELMRILALKPNPPVWKSILLYHLDTRWHRYLKTESEIRDSGNLNPFHDLDSLAQYAQAMEEHFDSFFVDAGNAVISNILQLRERFSNEAKEVRL